MQKKDEPFIDYRLLRTQVTMADVLRLLDWQAVSATGNQLRGPCPVHCSSSKSSRSLSVNLEKHAFHCFSCGAEGNQLDLAAAVFQLPLYVAARVLCDRLAIELPMTTNRGAET